MCEVRDFDLPDSFINRIKRGSELTPESAALIRDLAEQTGLPMDAIKTALIEEAMAAFHSRGILY